MAEDIDTEARHWREIRTLFGAYLHQDYEAVHGDAWAAIVEFARESGAPESNAECARELRALLGQCDDRQLEIATDRFGMAYYAPGDGYSSYRVWLTAVADYLDDPEAHPGPPERDAPLPG